MRLRGRSVLLALVPLLGGCFSYSESVSDRPVPAHVVQLTLNDRGRLALEQHIGSDVLTVEGSIGEVADSQFVVHVQHVATIGGQFTTWAGEPVMFRPEYVRSIRERHFSVSRTAILLGSATAAAFALVASPLNAVFGGSTGPTNVGGDGSSPTH